MSGCRGCNDKTIWRGITGAWFAAIGADPCMEFLQIAYCPQCGTLLDPKTAREPSRLKARHAHLAEQARAKRARKLEEKP